MLIGSGAISKPNLDFTPHSKLSRFKTPFRLFNQRQRAILYLAPREPYGAKKLGGIVKIYPAQLSNSAINLPSSAGER